MVFLELPCCPDYHLVFEDAAIIRNGWLSAAGTKGFQLIAILETNSTKRAACSFYIFDALSTDQLIYDFKQAHVSFLAFLFDCDHWATMLLAINRFIQ